MANAITVQLADALVTSLNGATFETSVTAVRRYLPKFDLKDLATAQLSVVPRGPRETMASRASYQHDLVVDVGLHKKITPTTENADCDTYMRLMEQITQHCRRRNLIASYNWLSNEAVYEDTLWNPPLLRELSVFMSVLRVTHRGIKQHS